MSKIKIGINGFGRIGRLVFRAAMHQRSDAEVVGINDLDTGGLHGLHASKYDTMHGQFNGAIDYNVEKGAADRQRSGDPRNGREGSRAT